MFHLLEMAEAGLFPPQPFLDTVFIRYDVEQVIRANLDSAVVAKSVTNLKVGKILRREGLALAAVNNGVFPVSMHCVIHGESVARISG